MGFFKIYFVLFVCIKVEEVCKQSFGDRKVIKTFKINEIKYFNTESTNAKVEKRQINIGKWQKSCLNYYCGQYQDYFKLFR